MPKKKSSSLKDYKLKLILEIEYDINPELYETDDVNEMAKIDEQDYPDILDIVMENSKDDDIKVKVIPIKKDK